MKTFAFSLFFAGEAHRTARGGAFHWGHERELIVIGVKL